MKLRLWTAATTEQIVRPRIWVGERRWNDDIDREKPNNSKKNLSVSGSQWTRMNARIVYTFLFARYIGTNMNLFNIIYVALLDIHSLLYNGYRGSFPRLKCGRGLTLTTHPHLVPKSWMSRTYTSPPYSYIGVLWDCFFVRYTTSLLSILRTIYFQCLKRNLDLYEGYFTYPDNASRTTRWSSDPWFITAVLCYPLCL
jgi:hypothetical protein